MRFALILALLPYPALAWDFSPDPICTLSYRSGETTFVVTYDATLPLYSVSVAFGGQMWAQDVPFTLRFAGGTPPQISTDRHVVSSDGRSVRVTDTGFSNVLSGLGSGVIVYANTGRAGIAIPLEGIDAPLAAFNACPDDTPATS